MNYVKGPVQHPRRAAPQTAAQSRATPSAPQLLLSPLDSVVVTVAAPQSPSATDTASPTLGFGLSGPRRGRRPQPLVVEHDLAQGAAREPVVEVLALADPRTTDARNWSGSTG